MTIGFLHLKSIGVAAQLGSLSRTAKALNITQPALSRRIADAEAALGVRLFDRQPDGVKPTPECLALLPYAEAALANVETAREAAQNRLKQRDREATVCFHDSVCDSALIEASKDTLAAFDGAAVNFSAYPLPPQISGQVLAGRATFGLRYFLDENPELESVWVMDDEFVVVCAPSHPFARLKTLTIHEMSQAQWIGYPSLIDHSSEYFEEASELVGVGGWKSWHMDSVVVRIQLLKAGMGISLLRRVAVRDDVKAGSLVELKVPMRGALPLYLTWRRGAYLGPVARYLSERIRERYRVFCAL